ncbi:hypothetical protein BCR44DRAFT_1280185 [Catenaria anguillulae PL171]|uniref:Uncharacterized protein n=1 Tax=Catenaria anguillulae PL171 TaxID=765915 RepID=A0A1Y2H8X4_9FUNG|nr:hypothetical protein BCR44DRAFT_1280185 [Catenaria anguillulae PL171]
MLSDSLRLTSPEATAGGGGSLHSTPPSASPGTCQDEEHAGLFMIHTYNSFDQQQQQHCGQPAASSTHARPRFVARRHSDVMPISYQLSKSWTPNDGDSALLEAPAHAAGDGSNVAPTSPTDSHFSQATTMQYSPTTSTFDSLAYQAPTSQAQAERPHPHVSPSSYSPHPHVLPTIPAIGIGGTAFHPHSIAPPPPPPTFPSTAADQSSPNPTAKKKMRSEPPPALLPVSSSAAVATPPSSAGLGLFNTSSLTAVDADAGVRVEPARTCLTK